MLTKPEPDLAPEIAHVLLMDVVGYSKLLVEDQIELLGQLNRIVRQTSQFRAAESAGRLIRLPTGDGMALLFFDSPETPVRCALEISAEVRQRAAMKLRMGIHSGPVKEVTDVNDRSNMAGAGIDLAQRVLDCGDAGHILLSQRVADDLKPHRHWNACLRDLGECEVKHGVRLHIYNLCKDGLGNEKLPAKVLQQQGELRKWRPKTKRWLTGAAGLIFLLALIGFWRLTRSKSSDSQSSIPEKSVAVLPFTNLSDEKQNLFFTVGVQDEILTNLGRIADLKVISRSSVMQYGSGAPRNLRAIAQTLGVSYLLEGSVQRVGERVRITAQLIDARHDAHVWAEHFDRDLSDVFAIQTEVAEKVAAQLKARLSPQEKAAIEERPTDDLEAYSLYVRGKALIAATTGNGRVNEDLLAGAQLLEQAVAKDPKFFLAYYQLAHAHDQIYMFGGDHTPKRLALADAAVQATVRLRPDAGETHLALGEHLYWGYRDYDRAREQCELASRALPNDPRPFLVMAYIDRRRGRSQESLNGFERALKLNPRDLNILHQIAFSYQHLRRYVETAFFLDQALAILPDDLGTRVQRANVDLESRADTTPLRALIRSVIEKDPAAGSNIADSWLDLALCERNPADAERALAVMAPDGCFTEGVLFPRAFCVGVAARAKGDTNGASDAFQTARIAAEKTVREQPEYAEALSALAVIDAALGKKEDAIREGKHAVELLPLTQDSVDGAVLLQNLAMIYAWTGEKDLAFEQISAAVKIPGQINYGQLRLHPDWDSLRGDARFEQIVQSLAPKE